MRFLWKTLRICQRIGSKRSLAAGLAGLAGVAALRRPFIQAAQLLGAVETFRQTALDDVITQALGTTERNPA